MLDLFEKFTLDMKILRVRFSRPWFPASLVYAMQDTYLANYKKGALSNGESYGDLRGVASLYPESVILAQDIKIRYSGRKEEQSTQFDRLLAEGSTGFKIGPFRIRVGGVSFEK